MGTTADIEKLIQRMGRANGLVDRAAKDGDKHEEVMNRFEQRLDHMSNHFGKIAEYEKQLAAMQQLDNGGPPLEQTFQPPIVEPAKEPISTLDDHSHVGKIHPGTGDPVK